MNTEIAKEAIKTNQKYAIFEVLLSFSVFPLPAKLVKSKCQLCVLLIT